MVTDTKFKLGEYITNDGSIATLFKLNGRGDYPILGQILTIGGYLDYARWTKDGRCFILGHEHNHHDLVRPARNDDRKQTPFRNIMKSKIV